MKLLLEYLVSSKMTGEDFAKAIGSSRGYIHDLKTGRRRPSLPKAILIEKATEGRIPVSAWHDGVEGCDYPLGYSALNGGSDEKIAS